MKHYIRVDENNSILEGWSDGLSPTRSTADSILVAEGEEVSFQFHLPGFEELGMNPPLYNRDSIPMYKWDGEKVVPRSPEEMVVPVPEPEEQPPTPEEALSAKVDFLLLVQGVLLPAVQTFSNRFGAPTLRWYIDRYYPRIWNESYLMKLVELGMLSEEEFEEVVG